MLNIIDWVINVTETVYYFLFGSIVRFFDAVSAAVIFIAPLYIGAIWGGFLPDLEKIHKLTSIPQWRLHPTPIYFLLVWLIALGWQYFSRRYNIEISARRKVVFREIRYICEGLAINENAEADIRCTVWLFPQNEIKTDKDTGEYLTPARIVQWADYYPQRSPYKKDGRTYRRVNPKAGRIFRLYRGKRNQLFVGILGETVSQGMEKGEYTVVKNNLPENCELWEYLSTEFNFRRWHAKKVTADRKSFFCIALIEKETKKPLGVVYFDSRNVSIFTDNIVDKVFEYLPRLMDAVRF